MASKRPDAPRPEFCKSCPLRDYTHGYLEPALRDGSELLLTEHPSFEDVRVGRHHCSGAGTWLRSVAKRAAVSIGPQSAISDATVIGCAPRSGHWVLERSKYNPVPGDIARAGIEHCKVHHLQPILQRPWRRILAMGEGALQATTGKAGIDNWRGSPLPLRGSDKPVVMPTLAPTVLAQRQKYFDTVVRDFRQECRIPGEQYELYATADDFKDLDLSRLVLDFEWYDVERGMVVDEITLAGLSDGHGRAYVIDPRKNADAWEAFREAACAADELCAHNMVGAELMWMERLKWEPRGRLIDTMLIHGLVEPEMPHHLGYVVSRFAAAVHWKGRGDAGEDDVTGAVRGGAQWRTWDQPDALPRELGGYGGVGSADESYRLYNARDNAFNYMIVDPLLAAMDRLGLSNVYWNELLPVAREAHRMSVTGWPIDGRRVGQFRETLSREIAELEVKLPPGLAPHQVDVMRNVPAPPDTYKPKVRKCKGAKKDGTSHAPVELTFNGPSPKRCPGCSRLISPGKMTERKIIKKPDKEWVYPYRSQQVLLEYARERKCKERRHPKTDQPTADSAARRVWGRKHPEFLLVNEIADRQKLLTTYAKPTWLNEPRLYFRANPIGTVSGRWSSSGQRRGLDPNIQNQPKEIQVIYLPEHPDWGIVQADFASAENWLTAWLAGDMERLRRLAAPGYSEHADLASRIFETEVIKGDKATKHLYAIGKRVNHGVNYGLGARKLQAQLEDEEMYYTQAEVKRFFEVWAEMNRATAEWQRRTISEARQQGKLTNPFGRTRWFPNADSLATEALSYLPQSTLAAIQNRVILALNGERYADELDALRVGVRRPVCDDECVLKAQIHDSIIVSCDAAQRHHVMRGMWDVMTQPWPQLDNFRLGVEVEWSSVSWGDCKVVEPAEFGREAAPHAFLEAA